MWLYMGWIVASKPVLIQPLFLTALQSPHPLHPQPFRNSPNTKQQLAALASYASVPTLLDTASRGVCSGLF